MTKKVLIIEDSPLDAAIVKERLKEEGLEIDIASTGNDGFNKALEMRPDLIVLDLMLPDISGFDLCSKLKKEISLARTIIVILSIKDNIDDITKALRSGADDYIIKPPAADFLVKKIKLYLGVRP